jgi:hypothetical protein
MESHVAARQNKRWRENMTLHDRTICGIGHNVRQTDTEYLAGVRPGACAARRAAMGVEAVRLGGTRHEGLW